LFNYQRLTAQPFARAQMLVVLVLCMVVALPVVLAGLFIMAGLQLGRRRRRHKQAAAQSGRPPRHPQVSHTPTLNRAFHFAKTTSRSLIIATDREFRFRLTGRGGQRRLLVAFLHTHGAV
jgi:hypothetical protein